VNCETQEEVDELWKKLSAGGKTDRCGWLKDKYGLSQIIPSALGRADGRQQRCQSTERDEGDAANGQDRHRAPAASLRSGI